MRGLPIKTKTQATRMFPKKIMFKYHKIRALSFIIAQRAH